MPVGIRITVSSPDYCSDVSGNVAVNFRAVGNSSVDVKCWKQEGKYGTDSIVASKVPCDADGYGSFIFPADDYPHGPITVRIIGRSDVCYLQLYNTGGVSWNERIPSGKPLHAQDYELVFEDDFNTMPNITAHGAGGSYAAHTSWDGDFSAVPFTSPGGKNNPFLQRDTYLRIRANQNKNSTGFISSLGKDNLKGFGMARYGYFECRFIAPYASGTWPAFWLNTANRYRGESSFSDELDIIEAYGGSLLGDPDNKGKMYSISRHAHDYAGISKDQRVSNKTIAGKSGWQDTFHTYACKITPTDTIYYFDDIEVVKHATMDCCQNEELFFMINLAIGGNSGWPYNLLRYNGIVDMYVDYVRVYKDPDNTFKVSCTNI